METETQIFVFRTNIDSQSMAQQACDTLSAHQVILRATVDLDDCDRVLRVETQAASSDYIIDAIAGTGVKIEELT